MRLTQLYYPLLKTTDAELKGYDKLSTVIKDGILPIFELTKSRRSKKDQVGSLSKRIAQLAEIIGDRDFILDLTTEVSLSNFELTDILNSTENGHEKWRRFVDDLKSQGFKKLIPMVHYNENNPDESIVQARELEKKFEFIAFRADARDERMLEYVRPILDSVKNSKKLILILDIGFIPKSKSEQVNDLFKNKVNGILSLENKPCKCVLMGSSFPKSVANFGDSSGEIPIQEVHISNQINKLSEELIVYGDYGSIHPERYPSGGGGWIPRIDFPLDDRWLFYRSRINKLEHTKDAYIRIANDTISDPRYTFPSDSWGISEIESAARGEPNGKSPSYWIAVRVCLHITRQSLRLLPEFFR